MGKHQLRESVVDLLLRIEKENGYSHLLIDHEIKSGKVAPKDEGLLTEIVYGTVQRKLTLDYYLDAFVDSRKKVGNWVRMLLSMSVYQMVFLDKIPDHAIIHEAVEIAKRRGHKGVAAFVNGVLRNMQRNGMPDFNSIKDPVKRLSVETSHPEWLIKRWITMYGEQTVREMCMANLERKPLSVRIQPLKISRQEVLQHLEDKGFKVRKSDLSDQGIIIDSGNILKSKLFADGYITIQDQSSMLAAEMLDAKPGMTVLDACSAPGGKTTHIAEKMENRGEIHAYDIHEKKAKLVTKKAKELKLTIIDAQKGDARNLAEKHEEDSFDRILVDAPCSGLGVIRGKPDIKYRKQESDMHHLSQIQLAILNSAASLLKIGGYMIYSTCTVDKEENEGVVEAFLKRHPDYEVDPGFFATLPDVIEGAQGITEYGLQLFPQTFHTDGFFLTRLVRKEG